MAESMSEAGMNVLVFPYPAAGHMIPLLEFARRLASRGLAVTILVTPKNLPQITPLMSDHSSITSLVLPFPDAPSVPAGVENTLDLPAGGFRSMMLAMGQLRGPLLSWFRRHPSPPCAIISDMFLGWTHHLACELNIRRYCFNPSGAFTLAIINTLWTEMPRRKNAADDSEILGFAEIPNSPAYPWRHLSTIFRSYREGDPISEFIKDCFRANLESHGTISNTFLELEGVYLDYIVKKYGLENVWSIGPLLPADDFGLERGGPSPVSTAQINSWLDSCEDRSVVYVCFGSQTVLSNVQIEELALGLEKSGVKFVLCVKGATRGHDRGGEYGVVPTGFEDRVGGRGIVITGWAPQVLILRHRAVVAFLSHCGWNSTLESIAAGVPILAWPMGADQFLNATLLVDQLNIAVSVCEGEETVPSSDDLARFLAETRSEEWAAKRDQAMALRGVALNAVKEGGSSFKNIDDFVNQLSK